MMRKYCHSNTTVEDPPNASCSEVIFLNLVWVIHALKVHKSLLFVRSVVHLSLQK